MSVTDLADYVEGVARRAVLDAKAIDVCQFHPDATIRRMDDEAERRAYAFATSALKRDDQLVCRDDVLDAVKRELDLADDECNQCANLVRD